MQHGRFVIALWGLCVVFTVLHRPTLAQGGEPAELRLQHARLAADLARSDFGRPLLIESSSGPDRSEGVVHAVLELPLQRLAALARPQRWCEVLMLHPNTRSCQADASPSPSLQLALGGKTGLGAQGVGLTLGFEVSASNESLVSVHLSAAHGPLGTRDYDLRMQAIALEPQRSFVRFQYRYGYGLIARLAMQSYLSTAGQHKVGFSRETSASGEPGAWVGGMRGVIERNTMRYFLAMDAVLQTLELPASDMERRLRLWFDATQRHPRQLYELDWPDYLALKREQLGL